MSKRNERLATLARLAHSMPESIERTALLWAARRIQGQINHRRRLAGQKPVDPAGIEEQSEDEG